jgi:3-hydroxyacyl-CoA dehydrogenase / enoyl-CoA hydratase / 3-hydroxybutyryl-CoA epimerase
MTPIEMKNNYITLHIDEQKILHLVFDQADKSVNTMGSDYFEAMQETMAQVTALVAASSIVGVYVCSGKSRQFFAGGDIKEMLETPLPPSVEQQQQTFEGGLANKALLRTLETLGVPVAVGINGACLGGGMEIGLACHYRVVVAGVSLGLPEANIGLLPGAGGLVRTTYLLGMQTALDLIAKGKQLKADKALETGLVDCVVASEEQLAATAIAWILDNPEACQPWDKQGYRFPGGDHNDPRNQQFLYFGASNTLAKTRALMPAQQAIFSCIAEAVKVDFDTAMIIESRYFLSLFYSQTARNMMLAFFIQMGDINAGKSRPECHPKKVVSRLGIIGAGQMGAGIAVAALQAGMQVVLKDISAEALQRGVDYVAGALQKNRRLSDERREAMLANLVTTEDYASLAACEAVIEAVFENRALKAQVTTALESVLSPEALIASNTSALPITDLAKACQTPARFIGMHFFSPAEKMPLVEIICGRDTDASALAMAFDLAQQLGKMPIVVNDGPGFFTSRVISQTITQGSDMLEEGINPVLIEAAAKDNGSPVGPLSAIDEISQETAYRNGLQHQEDAIAQGKVWQSTSSSRVIDTLVNTYQRRGKRLGGGYYEYPPEGGKFLWPGLKVLYAPEGYTSIPYQDIRDRLLFSQSLEAVRAMQEGVIERVADGNIGSIMGIGFPAQTGGVFQYINAYGLQAFVARADELAERYGYAFEVPELLRQRAAANQLFL